MPRDINGNFTLDPSNPVSPGTVIETGWANPTLVDIGAALTDSLSRSGSGGMLSALKFADGTVAAPGMAFANEPSSGFYRAALNDFRVSIGSQDVMRFAPGGIVLSAGKTLSGGSVTSPIAGSAITGGSINGTPIGGTTPAAGAFTTVTGTTLTGTTSVVTPKVDTPADVGLSIFNNGVASWQFMPTANVKSLFPSADNAQDLGGAANRVRNLYAVSHVGTLTNDNAPAGSVGEYVTASLAQAGQLALTSGVPRNMISIVLTGGDWDVGGVVHFNYGPTDTIFAVIASTSTVSGAHGALDTQAADVFPSAGQVQSSQQTHRLPTPTNRLSLPPGNTTVFLVASATFTGGYFAHGMIWARRRR